MPFTFFWNKEIVSLKDQFEKDRNVLEEKCRKTEEELQTTQLQLTEQKAESKRLQQARDKAFQSLEEGQNCKALLMQDLEHKNATIEDLKEQLEQFVQERNSQNVLLTKYKNRLLLSNNNLSQELCVTVELSDADEKMKSLEERLASELHHHEKQMKELQMKKEHQGKILKECEDKLQEKQTTIAQLPKDLEEQKYLNQKLQERKTTNDERMKEEEALRMNKEQAAEIEEKETCVQTALQAAEEHKSSLQDERNERNNLARPRLPQEVLLAIGGWRGDRSTNIIESYDSRANRWVGVANCDETPHRFHGTVFLYGSVYLIGGSDGLHELCTTHKYDLANHTWQEVAPMNTQRSLVSVAVLDGFIYAMGGFNGWQSLNTAEKFIPDANKWIMIAPMNEQRSNTSSTAYNGKIYICGGSNEEQCLSTAECYNPRTNQWTMISAMSSGRSGAGVIAYFNEIYVLGGFNGKDRLKTVEAFNPITNTWRPLPPMLKNRSNFGIGVVKDKLYAVGGFNITNCVESFDVKTGVWSEVCNMNVSRCGLSCSVVYDLPNMADYSAAHSSPPEEVPEE